MDKAARTGLLLIGLLLLVYFFVTNPTRKDVENYNTKKDSLALVTKQQDSVREIAPEIIKTSDSTKTLIQDSLRAIQLGSFGKLAQGVNEECVIENDVLKIILNTKGGNIRSVQLKKFRRADGTDLILLESGYNNFNISFPTRQAQTIKTSDLYFSPSAKQGESISMTASLDENTSLVQTYSLKQGSYLVGYDLKFDGMNSVINSQSLQLDWSARIPKQEKALTQEMQTTTIFYKQPDKDVDNISESKETTEDFPYDLKWIGFKQNFFNSTIISDKAFSTSKLTVKNINSGNYVKELSTTSYLPFNASQAKNNYALQFYFGPNDYNILKESHLGMEKMVKVGWGVFGWVNMFITIPIFEFLSKFIANFGIIILLLTLIIKLALFPMVYGSYKSMAKMKVLKPDIDLLNEKFKDDAQRRQQETMKLYKKAGVSPLGGCLPMLLQLPFLMSMFQFFPSCIDLRQQGFLWCTDLSTYDSILNLGTNIPFYGDHVSLWTILMTLVTLAMTFWSNQFSTQPKEYKWIGYVMPVIFLGIFNNYSAGFSYYSTIATAMTLGQQLIARRLVDDNKLLAKIEENRKRPESQTKSAFQRRLDDAMKQQQQKKKK
ncbi:MAG: membrane protein insertase YidC [Bacteroidetes bacterium]|nr:membrane protein insertase YidC [Bacteroidota bacterium]